jgi:hypothetical protein
VLDLHALRHGLDDEVDVAERVVARRAGDAPERALDLLAACSASRGPSHELGGLALGDRAGLLEALVDERWSTSLRTTGTSAAAMTWAISPPITPAPTTAALKTNMGFSCSCREDCERGRLRRGAHGSRPVRAEAEGAVRARRRAEQALLLPVHRPPEAAAAKAHGDALRGRLVVGTTSSSRP